VTDPIQEGESTPANDSLSVIVAAFAPLGGKRILDVGCGAGTLAGSLSVRGANVTGIDPNEEALSNARRAVPEATFRAAGAEAMPFADGSFDGAVFLNSLHHVPEAAIGRALREAARVVKPAGPIVIIEPLAEGSFFSALRSVEDETRVRAAAQGRIRQALDGGMFEELRRIDYLRHEYFADPDQFLARIVAVDTTRADVVAHRRPEVEAVFRRYARPAAEGSMALEQPMRAHILAVRV
jgi:ubiquinone/menaquinone biosynthesis C-methylase UbiE